MRSLTLWDEVFEMQKDRNLKQNDSYYNGKVPTLSYNYFEELKEFLKLDLDIYSIFDRFVNGKGELLIESSPSFVKMRHS